jgi:hypothetical protein
VLAFGREATMTADDWSRELALLQNSGVALGAGLTDEEFARAEAVHRFRFPPDLRSLLACALPLNTAERNAPQFPDWRNPASPAILDQLTWPFEGIAFDIENNSFWWGAWGPRPAALSDAVAVAKAAVEAAPRLIPIYGHRYLPAEPEAAGNPVFSVHQTDIIYYGADLRRYVSCEFGGLAYASANRDHPRRIRLWTELIEDNA